MISAPSGFTTVNADLAKKPTNIIVISQRDALVPTAPFTPLPIPIESLDSSQGVALLAGTSATLERGDQSCTFVGFTNDTAAIGHGRARPLTPANGHVTILGFESLPAYIDPTWTIAVYGVADMYWNGGYGIPTVEHIWAGGFTPGTKHVSNLVYSGVASGFDPSTFTVDIKNDITVYYWDNGCGPSVTFTARVGLVVYYTIPSETGPGEGDDGVSVLDSLNSFRPIIFTDRKTGVPWQRDYIEVIQPQTTTISPLDGGATLGELVFTVQDHLRKITATFPDFVWEGKKVRWFTGFASQDASAYETEFALLWTGIIDKVENVNANDSYQLTCTDNKSALTKVIYTVADDGQPTDSSHLRTLNAHPLDLLLHILTDEIGYPETSFDRAKIETYRDGIFAGVQFQFSIDSPPAAKDFIEQQLMKPLGGYMWTYNQGRLTVNFFYPIYLAAVMAFNEDNIVDVPEAGQVDLINVVSFRFDKDASDTNSSGKFMAESIEQDADSIAKYGQYGQQVIESDGVRSAFQGFFLAALTARMIFLRYGSKGLKFEPLHALWTACVLEPGDLLEVTHHLVPDRTAGTLGITAKKFYVLDRTYNPTEATVDVLAVDASFLDNFGAYEIAPDSEGDFTAGSPYTIETWLFMFLCGDDEKYSDGDHGHILG